MNKDIYIGNTPLARKDTNVQGALVEFENEKYYKISNSDAMRPFFMSIVSESDHWMFISSNGGLTAGRRNAESSLFPYYTDDKITESVDVTGSKTIMQVSREGKTYLWEPFSLRMEGVYKTQRNLYKNQLGNKIVFEEVNHDLKLVFQYAWNTSEQYGFIRKSKIINTGDENVEIAVLDGIQNIVPYGVGSELQNRSSNLVDAYKKCELEKESGIGIFALSAIIVDRAEPSESLQTTTVWSDRSGTKKLLSSQQLDTFRAGGAVEEEVDVRAEKGAYFLNLDLKLKPQQSDSWIIVAEVNQSMVDVAQIKNWIAHEDDLSQSVQASIDEGSEELLKLNCASDGRQLTADKMRNTRHFSNTLFNIMRGGIFDDNYTIEKKDFSDYLKSASKPVYKAKSGVLENLPETFTVERLQELANEDSDADFNRLAMEYLPLKFSRRHGDPSRPWNKFSINLTSDRDGSKILDYEGNWRDIFQNWEALAYSYPEFIDGMIFKFLNATTFDGYNPYRVTKGGFDWETVEPDDPWSYIGYWGDHQIIYLLKFLEIIEKHDPSKLASYFDQDLFVYANVPYRIKSYKEIVEDPKDTILFNEELDDKIRREREQMGADGALLKTTQEELYHVNFTEKILATLLAKISNFIPDAGIWMNTQRPEWNDANNALVGNGVSMVTLYYLRRFIAFYSNILEKADVSDFVVSEEMVELFSSIMSTLASFEGTLSRKRDNKERKQIIDQLGQAASDYRNKIYDRGFTGKKEGLTKSEISKMLEVVQSHLEQTIKTNEREDGMYHAYNLITFKNDGVEVSYLPEMLEGQVAVLSSGFINAKQSLRVLDGMKASALFRPDQYSYTLYPDRELPRFTDKNNLDREKVQNSLLLQQLEAAGNTQIVEKDLQGNYHYNGTFNNADSLEQALNDLPEKYGELVERQKEQLLADFEEHFNHKAFTGRSGTFYGYEGLGSIYWHMVSKLLLAVQETCWSAINDAESDETIGRLLEHYYEINEGIGVHKSPELYGAFPTDPYSHTPGGRGAQQPGMTGQVKEDILCRFGELGVIVEDAKIKFNTRLLRHDEFLKSQNSFEFYDLQDQKQEITIDQGCLAFTYCQVPIIYELTDNKGSGIVIFKDGSQEKLSSDLEVTRETSRSIFKRENKIDRILVKVNR
ncbi:hypothetical protein BST97_00475 [Nonlabens spongiae]|uniref:Cellobiose phosphorylase n=1 Tax=Nonlabens spongiae TaxID=331648 RepID=A0A1W6MGA1_9FLAO|nr:hypothetical protein [Nonlabens spongiae]ARN76600.1 hypothetical protein BST97_00475 [Nonlabens spongiae]